MAVGLLATQLLGVVGVGLPPHRPAHADPLSGTGWVFVLAGVVVSFYLSVRLVTWLMVKISSLELFMELRRELDKGRRKT